MSGAIPDLSAQKSAEAGAHPSPYAARSKTSYQLLSLKIGDILSWITYSIYELYVHELHVQLKLIFPLTFDENTVIFQNANSDLIKAYF